MLHKLAKFHHENIFTSQVSQQNVFRVSCLGIWDVIKFEYLKKLKYDFLKNEKTFQREIKNIFPYF